jgi:hypothetical protein
MTIRRAAPTLILAVLLGGVVRMWEWTQPASTQPGVRSTLPMTRPAVAPRAAATMASALGDSASAVAARTIPTLSADSSAALAEQVALQQFAGAAALPLTPEQWATFAEVSSHYQAVRQAYEATLATVTSAERGHVRMEIPAYSSAGDALRAQLYGELREKLGAAASAAIAQRLGGALEGHFGGFGLSVQTLDFVAASGAADNDYQVTRTVKYWNSDETSDRLITRRETHFPGLEDPSGHRWGPFLSVFASRTTDKASS